MNPQLLRKLEDLLYTQGIQTFCRYAGSNEWKSDFNEELENSDPKIEIVVSNFDQAGPMRVLQEEKKKLSDWFGDKYIGRLRTATYYFSYRLFGSISSIDGGYFLSTTVVNSKTPNIIQIGDLLLANLNLNIVAISNNNTTLSKDDCISSVKNKAQEFNDTSRYIKIGLLQVAFTESRFVRRNDPPLSFEEIIL